MPKKKSKPLMPPKNIGQYRKQVNMGQKLHRQGDIMGALTYLTSAWKFNDTDPTLSVLIADCLVKNGNKTAAMNLMAHTLENNPNESEVVMILGNACMGMEFFDLATKFYQKYMEMEPQNITAYNNFASALREDGKLDESISFLQDILPIFPEADSLWNTLGATVGFRDNYQAALVFYEEALRLNPENVQVLNNIAPAYFSIGEYDKAEQAGIKSHELDPKAIDPVLFLSSFYLRRDRLDKGWEYYLARDVRAHFNLTVMHHKIPYWDGSDLSDKKIIVFGEQGIGDHIMFSWLYNEMIEKAGEVAFSCEERLVGLFKNSFPKAKVGKSMYQINRDLDLNVFISPDIDFSDYDYMVLAGDLPYYLWPSKDDIKPNDQPIIIPEQSIVDKWKEEIDKLPHDISIGIAWRSGIKFAKRSRNYATLLDWEPLLKHKNVNFINVQYGDCQDELDELEEKTGIKIHNLPGLDLKQDIEDTTAMMTSLDMVMGPVSAPIMQSSFAGVESWAFSSGIPWWSFGDEYPIWQQSMRVVLKNENDPWTEFMIEKAPELTEWLKKKRKEKK